MLVLLPGNLRPRTCRGKETYSTARVNHGTEVVNRSSVLTNRNTAWLSKKKVSRKGNAVNGATRPNTPAYGKLYL